MRTLIVLGTLTVLLFSALLAGIQWSSATLTPKLALDLEGGTQIILTPVSTTEKVDISPAVISQAIGIIRQRVDASGVSETEITSQGGKNIVVGLPGEPTEETLDLVRTSAKMDFRPVLVQADPAPVAAAATDSKLPKDAALDPTKLLKGTLGASDDGWITQEVMAAFEKLDCTNPANLTGGDPGDPTRADATCAKDGTSKFILGPVEIEGADINSASSGLKTANGVQTNEWIVSMNFNSRGGNKFASVTKRLATLAEPKNRFAVVLDGLVISPPSVSETIASGSAEISGNFTRKSAATLAQQLSFGALPLSFEVQSEQQVSATIGSEQLQKGLLAGMIGLILVVIYSMFQYRALGGVTVASLVVAALLTYGALAVLSWTQGYRLSLPGVAGIIVAIGITADSFIVYFERIRDELRDGRPLTAAVDKGWARAKRTILASDAVNFLAAAVLYNLAVGGVRGFAFTLGLTTLIDLVVVFLFTHPLMMVLAKTKFFGKGHPASGLDPRRLGVTGTRYVGRGKVVTGAQDADEASKRAAKGPKPEAPVTSTTVKPVDAPVGASFSEAAPTMTIAERRAAARAAKASPTSRPGDAEPTHDSTEGNES